MNNSENNKNYPNNRGGCINGYCEMPINIKSRGYKYYDPSPEPFLLAARKLDINFPAFFDIYKI